MIGSDRVETDRRAREAQLRPFRDEKGKPRKMPKAERRALIDQQFPSVHDLDWGEAFANDTDLFARIMRDILKIEQREPGRSGPRPNNLDYKEGLQSFKQMMGEDYSTMTFIDTFAEMSRSYSVRHLARKVGMTHTRCFRLLRGLEEPTKHDFECIAKGFGKDPSFFTEYRKIIIVEKLSKILLSAPETTISYYEKMRSRANG